MTRHMTSASLGIVDPGRMLEVLQKARHGEEVQIITLMRTIFVEEWLRDLRVLGIINLGTTLKPKLRWQASIQGWRV